MPCLLNLLAVTAAVSSCVDASVCDALEKMREHMVCMPRVHMQASHLANGELCH
jgi:hypothetical protein